jgi:hypothetical protein
MDKENSTDEITPAMVKAGIAALVSFNPEFDGEEEGAVRIFRAMIKAAGSRPLDALAARR